MHVSLISAIVIYLVICYSLYLLKPEEIFEKDNIMNYPMICILISIVLALVVE